MTVTLESLAARKSRHGRITALSMMKDEGPYVLEWVAHHLAVGFTDFVVYTNDCTDGTDEMLKRLETLGLVTHRVNRIPKGIKPQPSALKHAQDEPEVAKADWLLTFDADEFLCIRQGDGRLDGLIDAIEAEGANGMVVTWRIFGSGGVRDWSRAPVTEQYLMAAPPMWNKGWGVKTLFRFDPEIWKLGIHRPKMKNKVLDTDFPHSVKWLNGSGRPMEDYFKFRGWRSIARTVGYDWAQMNHYAVKSIDAYALRRFRGNVNDKKDKYNDDYWALQDRNEVRDDTMLRYSDQRGRTMAALLSDPVLAGLHEAALDRAEARLAEFKGSDEYASFVAGLEEAGRVPITQVSATPPKPRDPAKIAGLMSEVERRVAGRRRAELEKPPEERDLPPQDLHVRGEVDASADVPLEWFPNHSIRLPADPRLFTPAGLLQIEAGKFQRNLARNLPTIAAGAPVLEIGAASGFLGLHLARSGSAAILVERQEGWRRALRRIMAENAIEEDPRLRVLDAFDGPTEDLRPETVILGDPSLSPDAAARLIAVCGPRAVVLTGRLLVEDRLDAYGNICREAGLTEPIPFDRTAGIGFVRPSD